MCFHMFPVIWENFFFFCIYSLWSFIKKQLYNCLHTFCDAFEIKRTLPFIPLRWAGTWSTPFKEPAIMARYLRYFTTVGDEQPATWEDEELHVASEELSPATGQFPTTPTFRASLQRLYSSDRFQVCHCGPFNAFVNLNTSVMQSFESQFYGETGTRIIFGIFCSF